MIFNRIDNPYVVAAQVAGFDTAIYGLPEKTVPLLFKLKNSNIIVATTGFSNFVSGRYAPQKEWGIFWKRILEDLGAGNKISSLKWEPEISVTYEKNEKLPDNFKKRVSARALTGIETQKCWLPTHLRTLCNSDQYRNGTDKME